MILSTWLLTRLCHPWQEMLCFPRENISISWPRIYWYRDPRPRKGKRFLRKINLFLPRMTLRGKWVS